MGSPYFHVLLVLYAAHFSCSEKASLNVATAQFAVDLLKAIDKPNENVFFSPASISFCLGMVHAGSAGETKLQLSRALYNGLSDQEIYDQMKDLSQILNEPSEFYNLSIANRMYVERNFDILQAYKTKLQTYFQSDIISVDFANSAESVRKDINKWVESQTNQLIKDMFPQNSLNDAELAMILVNAMYFKGAWLNKFYEANTSKKPFYINKNEMAEIDMMKLSNLELLYYQDNSLRMLSLPYVGDRLAMYIILPVERFNLRQLESKLGGDILLEMIKAGQRTYVHEIQIPKFKLEQQLELNDILQTLNVTNMFSKSTADLSGINGKRDLEVSSAYHHAFIEVNESGTESGAGTGVVVEKRTVPSQPELNFIVDQPFLTSSTIKYA